MPTTNDVLNMIKDINQKSTIKIYGKDLLTQALIEINTYGGVFVKDFQKGVLLVFINSDKKLQKMFLKDKTVIVESQESWIE